VQNCLLRKVEDLGDVEWQECRAFYHGFDLLDWVT
jgi:hypothetical protein